MTRNNTLWKGVPLKPPQVPVFDPEFKCYRVPLTQGKSALISECDIPLILSMRWRAQKTYDTHSERWYAIGRFKNGERKQYLMHKIITGFKMTDHKNGNGLDNRRENLRECTISQNMRNTRTSIGLTAKGVERAPSGKFRARIYVNKKRLHLGLFETEEEAARAYNEGALKYFGEFACLNVISEPDSTAIKPAGQ